MRFTLSAGRPPTTRPQPRRWIRRLTALAIALPLTTTGVVVVGELAASAHANHLTGTSQCQSNGTFTVSWTVKNDYNLTESVTEVSHTPGASAISGLPASIAASPDVAHESSIPVTQTGIPGTATGAFLAVHGYWKDKFNHDDSNTVALDGKCVPIKQSTPVAPTVTASSCGTGANGFSGSSYTVPSTTGVVYAPVPGTYQLTPGQHVTVTATPAAGYVFTSGQSSESFPVTGPSDANCTQPAAPQASIAMGCGSAQILLSNGSVPPAHFTGTPVTFTIKVTGEPIRTVTLQPGDTQTVNYAFADDSGTRLVQVFNGATQVANDVSVGTDCGVDVGPALTLAAQCTTSTSSDNWTVTMASTTPVKFTAVSANGLTTFGTGTVVAGIPATFLTPSSYTGSVILKDADSAGVLQPASTPVSANATLCSQPPAAAPTVAGSCTNGTTTVTFVNPAGATVPALFTVTDSPSTLTGGSLTLAPGQTNSVTVPTKDKDVLSFSYAYQASGAGGGGYPKTVFAGTSTVNCPKTQVLGNTFTKTPPKVTTPVTPAPVTTPAASLPTQVLGTTVTRSSGTLPFTGSHTVMLIDFAVALFGGGAALWLLSRRRRAS